ncbi:DUF4159 domain-containing protein [Pseudovibrio sp. SPO723]|uniref:DUF4159 domain-containing protein n=1 Tax=Nesiotobacter zosterae TaxID=392721 RepID=UPI0029C4AE45|nr:DUF4159 domain-containing protein [Pseudovibrio sp. SPO723]MDX5595349.1 DUF4159 domain-containing protein [Pseudovibrio sp. SPO723]
MSSLFPALAFSAPWVLAGLVLLPVLWWLLRLTPPRPLQTVFPPLRLLLDIEKQEETPNKSPWWLTLLRLLLAALLILALAGPVWNPLTRAVSGTDPLWLIIDNGWDAANTWDQQQRLADLLIHNAVENGQPVLVIASADGQRQQATLTDATSARDHIRALEPRSWPSNREDVAKLLETSSTQGEAGAVVWLPSLLEAEGDAAFLSALAQLNADEVVVFEPDAQVIALKNLRNSAGSMEIDVTRLSAGEPSVHTLMAIDSRGRAIAQQSITLDAGTESAQAVFDLPSDLRNDIAQINVVGQASSGTTFLVDERWKRRKVGILTDNLAQEAQPLLSPRYYLTRALAPFADLPGTRSRDLRQAIDDLIDKGVTVMVLANIGTLPSSAEERLSQWVENGGTLVRFAGPNMAAEVDSLIPVRLRGGDRTLGGSLSWKQPQPIGSFSEQSPFRTLAVPRDVSVSRQVLAQPSVELPDKTWASLSDGTPLVTADRRGRGQLVLFHVTADTTWSNLPLSGAFVEMLQAISRNAAAQATGTPELTETSGSSTVLAPFRVLNGKGQLTTPPPEALPVEETALAALRPTRNHQPGLYGADGAFTALNLLKPEDTLTQIDLSGAPSGSVRAYPDQQPLDLRGTLFTAVLVLALLDTLIRIFMSGALQQRFGHRAATALLIAASLAAFPMDYAKAQETDEDFFALDATLDTRLAYVLTGNDAVDEISRAGLFGLTRVLAARTALEPEAPVGVNLEQDELAFFPFLYWPIDEDMNAPSDAAITRLDAYMRNGGTVLIDTRDQLSSGSGGFSGTPARTRLRDMLASIDVPPLEPVPQDHVLTKTFYILSTFPGRYAGSPLWVEALPPANASGARPVRVSDGVSPILITANDMASAWAIDSDGTYLFPTVPPDPSQREMAFRVGVNILMYVMTGNYKSDQVHIPALLERLGQ